MSDNIVAGVTPGGFQKPSDVRILICYVLNSINQPLSKHQIQIILEDTNLANYFVFADAFSQLIKDKQIEIITNNNIQSLKLTTLGKDACKMFYRTLPISVRDKVVDYANSFLSKERNKKENEVFIEHTSNGFNVHIVIHENGFDLLNFTIFMPTQEQANVVKKKVLSNPTNFYKNIITYLMLKE